MLAGTNWILGFSHTGPAADQLIRDRHATPEAVSALLDAYMCYGIDAIMAPDFEVNTPLYDGIKITEEKFGRTMIKIATPGINVDDTAEGRRQAEEKIKKTAASGATFCLIHHASAEQLVNKNKQTIERLPDYLSMIREHGMIPGLSAHMRAHHLF